MNPSRKRATPHDTGTVSIARGLSKLGICSRAEGERLVAAGRVRVDGRVVRDVAYRLRPETAVIDIDAVRVGRVDRVYLMLNKPRGLVTTRDDPQGRATIYDCLSDSALPFVAPVGRLDKASEGLLLLTNDTRWSAHLLDPASHVDKVYHVQVRGVQDDTTVQRVAAGVVDPTTGERLEVKRVSLLRVGSRSSAWLEIVLDEGKNRHIRRLLEALDIEVARLMRIAIGPLALGTLAKGDWRHLTPTEVQMFTTQP
ncbi:MAG: rRNA pseudouridine synthase [Gemmatimonadaceae bacterium]|nr:rRNA pseudouridine synthase [Gemmatimonadaceae bacterium]